MIAKVLMTEDSKLATKLSKPWACRKKTSTKLLATLESPLVEKRWSRLKVKNELGFLSNLERCVGWGFYHVAWKQVSNFFGLRFFFYQLAAISTIDSQIFENCVMKIPGFWQVKKVQTAVNKFYLSSRWIK